MVNKYVLSEFYRTQTHSFPQVVVACGECPKSYKLLMEHLLPEAGVKTDMCLEKKLAPEAHQKLCRKK